MSDAKPKPFAEVPKRKQGQALFDLVVGGEYTGAGPSGLRQERIAAAINAAVAARERAAAAKALREASIDIATRSTTVFDAVSVLRARADAVERGE